MVGDSWERRWDSLRLFTPVHYDGITGSPFPGERWAYPTKDDVAAYLADFAAHHDLAIQTSTQVVDLTGRQGDFVARTAAGERWRARQVVIATGAFGVPSIPSWASQLPPEIQQVHSDTYARPDDLPHGPVLVVGGGNSGMQIALEVARTGRSVHLSQGQRSRHLPQRIVGRDLFWWLNITALMRVAGSSPLGRLLRTNDPVIGTAPRTLARAGVTFHPRAVGASGNRVKFQDDAHLEPRAVVWATGYRQDDRWIKIPQALDQTGALINNDGRTPVPGLHTIGRPWQRTRGSALLGFVSQDAERLAIHIVTPRTSASSS